MEREAGMSYRGAIVFVAVGAVSLGACADENTIRLRRIGDAAWAIAEAEEACTRQIASTGVGDPACEEQALAYRRLAHEEKPRR